MEGEWLCYGGGQFNGGSKVMLDGQFNGGSGYVTEVDGWMNGVLGHFYALSRLNWAGDNLGQ